MGAAYGRSAPFGRQNSIGLLGIVLGLGLPAGAWADSGDAVSEPIRVELVCPAGAERQGHPPPKGRVVSCHLNQGGRLLSHGMTVRWHDNGRLKEIVEYRRGELSGTWTQWNEQGRMVSRAEYLQDRLHGRKVEYFADGRKRKEIHYQNGEPHGSWKTWDEGGELTVSREYVRGEGVMDALAEPKAEGVEAESEPLKEPPRSQRRIATALKPIRCQVDSHLYGEGAAEARALADSAGIPVRLDAGGVEVVIQPAGESVDARIEGRPDRLALAERDGRPLGDEAVKAKWEELSPLARARLKGAFTHTAKLALATLKNVGIYLSDKPFRLKAREITVEDGTRIVFGAVEMQSFGGIRFARQVGIKLVAPLEFRDSASVMVSESREDVIRFHGCEHFVRTGDGSIEF